METQKDQVKQIVRNVWGASYQTAEPYFDRLYAAAIEQRPITDIVASVRGGDSFDWDLTLKIINDAIQFTTAVITLYTKWIDQHGRKPTKEELKAEIKSEKLPEAFPNPVVKKKVEAVAEELTK